MAAHPRPSRHSWHHFSRLVISFLYVPPDLIDWKRVGLDKHMQWIKSARKTHTKSKRNRWIEFYETNPSRRQAEMLDKDSEQGGQCSAGIWIVKNCYNSTFPFVRLQKSNVIMLTSRWLTCPASQVHQHCRAILYTLYICHSHILSFAAASFPAFFDQHFPSLRPSVRPSLFLSFVRRLLEIPSIDIV